MTFVLVKIAQKEGCAGQRHQLDIGLLCKWVWFFVLIQTLSKCGFGDSPNTFTQKAGFG